MSASEQRIPFRRPAAVRWLMQVAWPAFVAAAVTTGLVFSAIDPARLELFGRTLAGSREAAYTLGFLVFWILYAAACSLTWWITQADVQRAALRPVSPARMPGDRIERGG